MVDKKPPQAIDVEAAIIGACLLEGNAFEKTGMVTPECFYDDFNRKVFKKITELALTGRKIDLLTVSDKLEKDEAYKLTGITNGIASAAHVEEHCLIVLQMYLKREIIRLSTEAVKDAYDSDVLKQLDTLTTKLLQLTSRVAAASSKHISRPAVDNLQKIEQLSKDSNKLLGYSYGLKELDELTHGIQPGVIVIAARPSMGKSALMSQIITSVAQQGVGCLVFTLEVNASRYEMRMKSQLSRISFERIQRGEIKQDEWERLSKTSGDIAELPIWIDESATLSQTQLRSKCLQAYKENNVRCFAIDYVQLTEGGHENEGLSEMSRAIKIVSQQLNVPFIELSQLSREVEKRPDKKPLLSDLRNSGSIEQDADVVLLLYRPEYYGIKAFDKDRGEIDASGFAQIRVAKNKDGKVGTADLKFIGDNVIFDDLKKDTFCW